MVARTLRHVHALILAAGITLLSACTGVTLGTIAESEGVDRDAIVALDDGSAVAARISGNRVEVVAFRFEEDSWVADVAAAGKAGEMTAHLVSLDGQTGEQWNSFFFGTAPAGSSRVLVEGHDARGGQVTDGAWVIAFEQKGLRPDQLSWRVLNAAGAVVEQGSGIMP